MELIAKKYRVLKSLGSGAMGEVFLVLPPRGDPVALKLLKGSDGSGAAALSQFENEFKVLKKLSHPNIGKIFDYGYDEEQKKVFFTSPWLKGQDIFTATHGLSFEKCEELFIQLLRAINYLHQKSIIHCDLKPGNIFVENGSVLLLDFGLAGYFGESIVGTPTYLAPEIYRGDHHSVASDVYAMGVVFYNCLTRAQPFSGASLQEIYDRHRTFTPPSISQLNANVPKYFSDIVATMLSKKPEERFQSASAVIEEISAYSKKKYTVETPETLLSYLPATSELIGRKEIQWRIHDLVKQFLSPKIKTPFFGLFLYGGRGLGKSKFIAQLKNELQLEKVAVEEITLPMWTSERKVLDDAKAVIVEDIQNLLSTNEGQMRLVEFMAFLEQKILSPQTNRFILVITGSEASQWDAFARLFPKEAFYSDVLALTPFTEEEMRFFLRTIIGQKEIPEKFVSEIYRITEGNPGFCTQIVQSMIEKGLLFDGSGRWSTDLLTHLNDALKKVEMPKSIEEQMQLSYQSLDPDEKNIVDTLALCPEGLREKELSIVTQIRKIDPLIKKMSNAKILHLEDDHWFLYRSSFVPFVLSQVPLSAQKKIHTRLASKEVGLSDGEVWYHQSLGDDLLLAQGALEQLANHLNKSGKKEEALDAYQRLSRTFVEVPLQQKLNWGIKTSELLIWLNRFVEAEALLSRLEAEIDKNADLVPLHQRLVLLDKKGLALLHMENIESARKYFEKGRILAKGNPQARVEEARFLNDMAQIEMITGHSDKAISYFSESRLLEYGLGKAQLSEITNNDLGHVYYQLKEYQRAIELLESDVERFSGMKNQEPLARSLYTLGQCHHALKKYNLAIKEYEKCIKICKDGSLYALLLRTYNGLGNIYMAEGDLTKALSNYQKALEISIHLKDPVTKGALLANQGLIYRRQKNWPQSTRRFLMAKQILEEKEIKLAYENMLLSKCYDELTEIAREERDSIKALSFQLERVRLIEKSENLSGEQFVSRLNLAELYLETRLADSFVAEIAKLESLAKTDEQKEKITLLKAKWEKINTFDQESTLKAV